MHLIRKWLAIACGLSLSVSAYCLSLNQQLDQLLDEYLPTADVGLIVTDAKNNHILYQHRAKQHFTPASNSKLFVMAAALFGLGPDFRFETTVHYNRSKKRLHRLRDSVYFHFSGDPSLSHNDLKKMVRVLHNKGIRRIEGDVIIDTSYFQGPVYPQGMSVGDLYTRHFAPVSTVIVDGNLFPVHVTPSPTLHEPTVFSAARHLPLSVTSSVDTVTHKYAKKHCQLNITANAQNEYHFSGCYPVQSRSYTQYFAIANPLAYTQSLLEKALKKAHIQVGGSVKVGTMPKGVRAHITHRSAKLRYLLRHMMKVSDNLYANAITKTLGHVHFHEGSFIAGVRAIKDLLAAYTDINVDNLDLGDGAGNRYNHVTPRQVSQLLYYLYQQPTLKKIFLNMLPQSGHSGSLEHRLRALGLQNHINAKTGTMHDISALSGIVATKGKKHHLIFSMMINNYVGDIHNAKHVEDAICSALVRAF